MNEEVNNNEKKKQIRLAIIGVIALLLLTLGATFAFFLIDTDNSTSKSSIKGDIDAIDSIALQKVTENLHVNLSAVDMAEANKNTEYYGDDTANYVKTLEEGIHTLGKLTAEGGNGKTRYMCTANAVITMQVASENDMGKFFNTGDAYLYLNAGSLQQRIDLSELKASGTVTIPFEIGITSEEERKIDGFVEIINRNDDQTYLANKTLNIDVTFQDLECNVGVSEVETHLRKNDKGNKLTTNLINGLYRYQGNSIISNYNSNEYTFDREDTVNNNYICLGNDCSTETSNDMYRIIGVNEDGLMKVVKDTPVNDSIVWNSDSYNNIKWSESELYKYLNTDFYNTLPIELKNKILNTTWVYGDINENNMSLEEQQKMEEYEEVIYGDGDLDIRKEAGKNYAKLYSDFLLKEETKATDKTIGKVSLMSITDYCSSFENDKELNCISTFTNSLLGNEDSDDYGISWLTTPSTNMMVEFTMSRSGLNDGRYNVWFVYWLGYVISNKVDNSGIARPVFFLTSNIELSGEGTIGDPFRVAGIE